MKHLRIVSLLILLLTPGGVTSAGEAAPRPPRKIQRLTFSSNRSGAWRIWTARPDGTERRPRTEGAGDFHDVDPVFSPDGKTILFTSTRGGRAGVWRLSVEGGKPAKVCPGDQAEWAPDGKRIVFRREGRIFTRDLATGAETRISPADWTRCSGPAWSPDGKTIAFACRWDAGNAIFIVAATGGGAPTKVYDRQGACEPHWSPDGKRIVYETETNICTIQPDGKKQRTITYFGGVQRYGRYSPDGARIIFCQGASEKGPWELYTIPAGGGTPAKLATDDDADDGSDMTPDWIDVKAAVKSVAGDGEAARP